ncbi:AAA family ATPase [Amycolatopsis nigrescens]|uniref:nSTAND1 domain-containing NTPase n=1 Tax=Amycolatopsis nigrescens TaxID=381445 RepID=UPI00039F6F73|nr:AAA family ATPase [Amycolatopsis nigrescens]
MAVRQMDDPGPALGPRGLFAERFALLYAEAGDPPLKKVTESVSRARRADDRGRPVSVSAQRVSDWRRGRNVPAKFVALAVVLEVLIGEARKLRPEPFVDDLYDLDAWRALWEAALASPVGTEQSDEDPVAGTAAPRPSGPDETGVCPYRGLAPFGEEDSGWFFGRERSTSALLTRLDGTLATGGIVMLVGASGAGKSSLFRAGLVPALGSGALADGASAGWPVVLMTPRSDPLKELLHWVPGLQESLELAADEPEAFAAGVRAAATAHAERHGAPGARLVLVVDQFEEAFSPDRDEDRLRQFVQLLQLLCTPAAPGEAPSALVVLGVRADFYGSCLSYPELAEALQDRQSVLGAMTATELRTAVASPAKAVGLQLEPGLVDLMLRDLGVTGGRMGRGGREAYDAGALPLLSHALLVTWQRRQAGKLTTAGYRAAGGIHGAVAATAERAWADLDQAGQAAARLVLLRLVRVGKDSQDTRRRSTRDELVEQAPNSAAAQDALEVLARARLVTMDAGSVEITHEALLQAWPRLRAWIDQDRAGNLFRQRLEEDSEVWDNQGRDASLLYRGSRLASARHWAGTATAALTGVAREFLATSARHRRRLAWFTRAAVALVVVCALTAAVAATIALRQRNDAVFGQVVAEADRWQDKDPSMSAQLNLVAHRLRPDNLDVQAKILSAQDVPLATVLTGHTAAVYLTTFSRSGNLLATASYDRTVRLWDTRDKANPKPVGEPLTGHQGWVSSAVFSADGRTLASAGDDHTIRLWDITNPSGPRPIGGPLSGQDGTIYLLAFSPDGRTLATATENRTVRLWDVRDMSNVVPIGQPIGGATGPVRTLAFSPDSRVLAAGGDDGTIRLSDMRDPAAPVPLGELTGHRGTVHSVAFSPDGKTLASGGDDLSVRLWDLSDPAAAAPLGLPLTGHLDPVWSVKFSPDGGLLASGSTDGTARLWNLSDRSAAVPYGSPLAGTNSEIFAVDFSSDGRTLSTGSNDGQVRLWSLPSRALTGHTGRLRWISSTKDGQMAATAGEDRTVRFWNLSNPAKPMRLGALETGHSAYVNSAVFSPDGRVLATVGGDRSVRLWDISDTFNVKPIGEPLTVRKRYSAALAFSPDGRRLVTNDDDQSLLLWDVSDPAAPKRLGAPLTGHSGYIEAISFNTDGSLMATASSDQTVRLWNTSDPAKAGPVGEPLRQGAGAVRHAQISPDGRTLVTSNEDRTVRLWDISEPARPMPLGVPLIGHEKAVARTVFSTDGSRIASTAEDDTIRVWDVRDPSAPVPVTAALGGRTASSGSVTFGPRPDVLASVGSDSAMRVWDLGLDPAVDRICASTKGILGSDQWRLRLPQLTYDPPC